MSDNTYLNDSDPDRTPLKLSIVDLLDALPEAVFTFQRTGDCSAAIPCASERLSDIVGLMPEEVRDNAAPLLDRIAPEDLGSFWAAAEKSVKTMSPWSLEFRINHPAKKKIWIEWYATPFGQGKNLFWQGFMLDVTERKRMEAEFMRGKQEFSSLAESFPDSFIRYDRKGRMRYLNSKLARDLEVVAGDMIGKLPMEVWPDGRYTTIDSAVRQAIDAGIATKVEFWRAINTPDAHYHQIYVVPERDSGEGIVGAFAFGYDLTELKQNEEQLRMAASVFRAAREGITITDPTGLILDTNPAFSRISGYEREDVLGKHPKLLASGRHDRAFYQAMWSSLLTSGTWSGEIINRRKNGELFTEHLSIMAVNDEAGKVKYYIGIFSDISQLKEHERHLQYIAQHDALTGLPNRLLLTDRLSQAIVRARRASDMLAILYLDLDNFKPINDDYGHEFGDQVLIEVSRRLVRSLRASDTVARIGGDEFVVLLAGIPDAEECEFTSHRLLEAISRPMVLDGHSLTLTASIGIALYPENQQDDADILLRYADQAMYLAKSAGRSQFVFYEFYARGEAWQHSQTVHDLREALNLNQIFVHYQPIIDLASGLVVKAEALVRWRHHTLGMVPPSEFIPMAEHGGLIHKIGDLVFKEAARVAQTWNNHKSGRAGRQIRVSINRSPRQFFHRDGVNLWLQYLMDRGIPGELLTVEITEGLLLDDRPEVLEQLKELRARGIAISLDDFGTGYSALSYLRKFNIDYLKIDRSFVRDIVDNPDDRAIVESIIVMARRLGIKLVAEGVETREQADLLRTADCDMAQGFLFAKPMPEDEFLKFVTDA